MALSSLMAMMAQDRKKCAAAIRMMAGQVTAAMLS